MSINLGKKFEDRFKDGWLKSFPKSFIYRLKDQLSGFKNISKNPCDFICYTHQTLFLIECKTHKGASIPFTAIPQYDELIQYKDIQGVKAGVVVWLVEKDMVFWLSIKEMEKMINDGLNSVGLKTIKQGKYVITIIPSKKLRTFLESDYTVLLDEN